jgi:hypothetical protein
VTERAGIEDADAATGCRLQPAAAVEFEIEAADRAIDGIDLERDRDCLSQRRILDRGEQPDRRLLPTSVATVATLGVDPIAARSRWLGGEQLNAEA